MEKRRAREKHKANRIERCRERRNDRGKEWKIRGREGRKIDR